MLKVDGPEVKAIYSGKEVDEVYLGDARRRTSRAVADGRQAPRRAGTLTRRRAGRRRARRCSRAPARPATRPTAQGLPGVFPPLAKSDYFAKRPDARSPTSLLNGLTGPVTVNGQDYNSVMPPMSQLTDDEIANIVTYVLNSWGNPGGRVTKEQVAQRRKEARAAAVAAH